MTDPVRRQAQDERIDRLKRERDEARAALKAIAFRCMEEVPGSSAYPLAREVGRIAVEAQAGPA